MSRFQQINQTLSEFRKSIGEEEIPLKWHNQEVWVLLSGKRLMLTMSVIPPRRSMTDFLACLSSALIFGSRGIDELREQYLWLRNYCNKVVLWLLTELEVQDQDDGNPLRGSWIHPEVACRGEEENIDEKCFHHIYMSVSVASMSIC